MSDAIKHECGLAFIRLRKPLAHFQERYGSALYGLTKLYLLMEKQHNRGQDGAGVATIKLDPLPGANFIDRDRSTSKDAIQLIFDRIHKGIGAALVEYPKAENDAELLKQTAPYVGELLLGHLRYATFGKDELENCHPRRRLSNWITRNLVVAGNFNMTNVDELFNLLVSIGQTPKERSDTMTVLEKIGHYLDMENERLRGIYHQLGYNDRQITKMIEEKLDVKSILQQSAIDFDGGYALAGLIGHGDAFVLRDPAGIRPCFWYADDEVVVAASERPAIQTAFGLKVEQVHELEPGKALIVKKDGSYSTEEILPPLEKRSCSFERIYFSRGSDMDVYRERIALGRSVCPAILEMIDHDLENTVFSFIPNTAEVACYGMLKQMEDELDHVKERRILELGPKPDPAKLRAILALRPRLEKVAIKDAKLRTFITNENSRADLVAHVYDITYGTVRPGVDSLVVIDDSIVRGTTLKQSILKMLDRLEPKKIVVVSSAPQIRYPDCYGIDMAKMGDLAAFQAAISLLKETKQENIIDDVYDRCLAMVDKPITEQTNIVKDIYRPFTAEQISKRIGELLTSPEIKAEVNIVYQSIEGLHAACPDHTGDWYFTGDYPTPGGNRVVNRAYINWRQGKNVRAY
ncbi:MAG: class II glutamine amidotransferase [Flavobacteriales bacterium]|jgi:amidophosphoribosyltransferase|nr:class II glutamine amidotransferase [Flavobacteriales bacterium]MBK9058499.1 class II glutamine amidotransferase [Flavobacteriales bacterium]QQS71485.1 MAG: class II glutamine amidotransferase [Flavobacteriales bacterium]HQV38349.1 amidophosphoribosyltransferase [Flavobacteriales bacterium]HQW31859.1 amidophosphoribosyltransferase [Flavobacteriales bacterium]